MATNEEHIESIIELGRDLREDLKKKEWDALSDDLDGITESIEILSDLANKKMMEAES